MNETANWWEPVFSGELEIGLNKEKLENVDEEALLYYGQNNQEMESQI
ncbi:hypothetical protein M4S82_05160 [Planococcus sp. MERTA32b]|nr:hypothetical protein [Planococcus sp. MER TA 32b]